MSGFAGILRLDGAPVEPATIDALRAAIRHRGPDGETLQRDVDVVMLHALFRTTDDPDPQPDPTGDVIVVTDLRLDGGGEELVRAAHARWGDRCSEHLEGDFAFVIWDRRLRRLIAARDAFGIKPLVYCHVPGKLFAFASEVAALLAIPGVPRAVDEQRIAQFVAGRGGDHERTFFRAIRRLPGGHTLRVEDGKVTVTRSWSLEEVPPLRLGSDAEYAEGFRDHFTRAMRASMRVRDPSELGAMLSGGLDSSSIACFARDERARRGEGPLRVYSWVFSDAMAADERRYQELVIASGGFQPCVLDSAVVGLGPWSHIDEILPGGPPYAPNMYLNSGAARAARQHGVRALLDGLGGDSTISRGGARLTELFVKGRALALARELKALARHSARPVSPGRLFLSLVARPLLPRRLLDGLDLLRGHQPRRDAGPALLKARLRPLAERRELPPLVTARDEHIAQLTAPRLAEGLELFDLVLAHSGIEGRYPLFDRRLSEYCVSLPADQKLAGGFSRVVARRALEGVVPPAVLWRAGKGAPGLHIIPALRRSRRRMDALVLDDHSALSDFVEMDAVRSTYRAFMDGEVSDFGTAVRLWSVAALGAWLNSCLEKREGVLSGSNHVERQQS